MASENTPIKPDFTVEMTPGRRFRLLQLSDMQVIDAAQMRYPTRLRPDEQEAWKTENVEKCCFEPIRRTVAAVQPDLILITGDIVYGEFDDSGRSLNRFLSFMGTLGVPWAPVFGNHDNESHLGVAEQCARYAAAPGCLFVRGNTDGNSNYTIALTENGRLCRMLYMMDSNGCGGEDPAICRIRGCSAAQLDFVRRAARDNPAPGFFCCHIPPVDYLDAYDAAGYQRLEDWRSPGAFTIGVDVPPAHPGDCGRKNEVMPDAGERLAPFFHACAIDGVFAGHNHKVNTSVWMDGIRYTMCVKCGTYDYREEGFLGGTKIEIPAENRAAFAVEPVYLPVSC